MTFDSDRVSIVPRAHKQPCLLMLRLQGIFTVSSHPLLSANNKGMLVGEDLNCDKLVYNKESFGPQVEHDLRLRGPAARLVVGEGCHTPRRHQGVPAILAESNRWQPYAGRVNRRH